MVCCPKCNSTEFYYIQRVYEYHQIEAITPDGDGVDLLCLDDSFCDEEYSPFLQCQNQECGKTFNFNLTEKE